MRMSMEQRAGAAESEFDAESHAPWWGRIGLLWLLFVPLCVAAQTLLLPIGPNDFWYHARAGRFIVEHGLIPTQNLFTDSPPWVSPSTPFHFQSWISEAAFFLLLRSGGLSAIIWARTICLALAFALVAAASWQRARDVSQTLSGTHGRVMSWDGAAKVAAGAGLWALAMSNNNFDARPQMFSVPLFAAWSLLLWRWRFASPRQRRKYLGALFLLMALWVNVHGAFFTALLISGAYALGATLDAARWKSLEARQAAASSWALLALGTVAACLNPRGAGIFAYVQRLATLQAGQKYIQEWQAPEFSLEEWNSMVFYIAPLAALALVFLVRHQAKAAVSSAASTWAWLGAVSLAEWAVAALLLVMAVRDKRSILWFALWFAPLWASLWAALQASRAVDAAASTSSMASPLRAVQIVNAALALGLCASLALCAPGLKASWTWPAAFRARFAPTPQGQFLRGFGTDPPLLLDRATPVEAVGWLLQHPPRQRLWHDMVFGSYMMWAADGRLVPMADPRIELYPDAFWDDYARLAAGPPDAPQVLASRGFSDALLDPKLQAPLIRRLLASKRWRKAFTSPPAVLLRSTEAAAKSQVKNCRKTF